ncbi:TadE/TadG family type IV pilus assembly protein [Roseovarius aestuarii]|uniref:TadE-like protein n=1 Tax=Roseovarius aestuarii TaxID=475083 RepID=A0A1X7BXN0_9RHOB|nr:TadE family protein [Roseovarius aestuarii]SMC14466.1 TadE-like protein [Roseovarius aestuarii]
MSINLFNIGFPTAVFRRFRQNEDGATLVEMAFVLPIFLLLFFGMIDFGRMAFHYVTVEKAMYNAARLATVRPPACPGVPVFNARGTTTVTPPPDFGSSCSAGANICANPGTITCSGSAANQTASEIWTMVQGAFPNDATIANLSFRYDYDSNLGFLGGPYVPVVTIEVQNLDFNFVSPLGNLAALAGGNAPPGLGADVIFPAMSVSMPGEDLAMGNNG